MNVYPRVAQDDLPFSLYRCSTLPTRRSSSAPTAKIEPLQEALWRNQTVNQETQIPADATPQPAPRKSRLLTTLFNPETRLGRFNRVALRALAVILVLFALGLAVGYLALYQPAQRQVSQLQADLRAASASSADLKTTLSGVNQKLESLTVENQALTDSLDQANSHIQVLQLLNQVRAARLALAANDTSKARDTLLASPQYAD